MAAKIKVASVGLEQIRDLSFPPGDFPISRRSTFRQLVWDFRDETKRRLSTIGDSKLIVDWGIYLQPQTDDAVGHRGAYLSPSLLEEIRIASFLFYQTPSSFGGNTGKGRIKPNTLVGVIRALVVFFSEIDELRKQYHDYLVRLRLASGRYRKLQSLAKVSLEDITEALSNSARADGNALKRGLCILCSPLLAERFAGALQWDAGDLKELEFRYPNDRPDLRRVMPDQLFRFLSNAATDDIHGFLHFLGLTPADASGASAWPSAFSPDVDGAACFDCYVSIRDQDRAASHRAGKKISNSGPLRRQLERKFDVKPVDFFSYLLHMRNAALTLVGLYTGARWSDYSGFKVGCIEELHGYPVLRGTVVKGEDVDAPELNDLWPAIPILRDAVTCLEALSRVTHNPFLFSPSDTVPIGDTPLPLSIVGLTLAINEYLTTCDTDEDWSSWRINVHQLRHTLARQLANADVGAVFISFQLKHLYTALAALPAEVTLGYGNLSQQRMDRAVALADANLDAARALYHPDAPVAGGGADEFRKRRKTYFEGKAAAGWSVDETIQALATRGIPFVSVGPGYCGGVKEELLKDGKTRPPPCIGDLQCNPGDCPQAIVTMTHKRHWERIVEKNEELSKDPRLQHARTNFEKAIFTGRKVLSDLGHQP